MTRYRVGFLLLMIAAGLLLLWTKTMRVMATVHGDTSTYAFPTRSVAFLCLPAVLALAAAILMGCARVGLRRFFSLVPGAIGVLVCCAVYGVATDRVIVRSDEFVLPEQGFPNRPFRRLALKDLSGVWVRPERSRKRSRGDANPSRIMEFVMKDGRKISIPVGDLVTAAMPEIVQRLKLQSVPFAELSQ